MDREKNGKGMWLECEQLFPWGERWVKSQKIAAKGTIHVYFSGKIQQFIGVSNIGKSTLPVTYSK